MMSRDLGGIQQAFIDYHDALTLQKHEVINITSLFALVNGHIKTNYKLPNLAPWCILSKLYFWWLVLIHKPDIIICHGNRAVSFASSFRSKNIPIIGVSHNYSYKHLRKCDYVLTLTEKLKSHLINNGFNAKRLLSIPNMIKITHEFKRKSFKSPLVIGSFGRFVRKKGFDILLEALNLLKKHKIPVKLLLGGDGPEKNNLLQLAKKLGLEKDVTFHGWVNDKDKFFKQIDLFCLPSISEPFGIILLEAMEHSVPIISTKSDGPEEIIRDNIDGLLAEIESSADIAEKLKYAINNQEISANWAKSAYMRLKENYDIQIISDKLSKILEEVKKHEL
jgi:glycosyltransferase involved in cell wall biosynthesis